jgi:hypothetical protein
MIWLLIAALGFAGWLSVVALFLALCRVAARADALQNEPRSSRGRAYLSSRDRRRSLSSLPSVWHVGQ